MQIHAGPALDYICTDYGVQGASTKNIPLEKCCISAMIVWISAKLSDVVCD